MKDAFLINLTASMVFVWKDCNVLPTNILVTEVSVLMLILDAVASIQAMENVLAVIYLVLSPVKDFVAQEVKNTDQIGAKQLLLNKVMVCRLKAA